MGLRIRKDIGYLLEENELHSVVVSNYMDILEELDENDQKSAEFISAIANAMQSYCSEKKSTEVTVTNLMGTNFIEVCEKNKSQFFHFVTQFYMCDSDKGILFRSPDLFNACRSDDLIDYYEMSIEANDIKYLNRSFYPYSGYIYKGGLEKTFPELVVGKVYETFEITYQHLDGYSISIHREQQDQSNAIVATGFFTPNIEPFAYIAAKCAGILLPHVTEYDFNCAVKPIIATHWS